MPVDYKRINGPDESIPYELFAIGKSRPLKVQEPRTDQIKQHKIYLQTGVVSQAKGSCFVEIGPTKIIVSVFDPREIPNKADYGLKGEVSCNFKFAPFSCQKRKAHQQNNEEKHYSSLMKKALESAVCLHELPNFQVDVHALVLEDSGSSLSGAIIGAGVALAEAGVPMFDIISSATLLIAKNEINLESQSSGWNSSIVSRSEDEINNYGILIISKLHTTEQICQFFHSGYITPSEISNHIRTLSEMCDFIVPVIKKCILKGVISNIKT